LTGILTLVVARHRRDLTPWLASVLVLPPFRGRGHSATLVKHVEAVAAAASVGTLWLYTWTAEPLYARLGWRRVGMERDRTDTSR
jgi:N-acetylglutamate synthase-like GNAT family acetyltransferase